MNYVSEWILLVLAIQVGVPEIWGNETNLIEPRIFNGQNVEIGEVPFLVSLHNPFRFLCGAVIISPLWALSAHHCSSPEFRPENYFIRAGSATIDTGRDVYGVKEFHFYDKHIQPHDIMLIKMKDRLRFSDKVKPAKLPTEKTIPPKSLRVSGWGLIHLGYYPRFLQAVNVSKVEWKDCIRSAPVYKSNVMEKWHLCYGGNGPSACFGDSGGPLADSETIHGIVSFGLVCGEAPGVYAKVSSYTDWIKRVTKI